MSSTRRTPRAGRSTAERLGKEVGFFQDPYSYYGHLQDDMLRAIRLVVDTGLHYKHWTRQQVVDYFHEHSAIDEAEVQSETDRYMAWPSQALGYKIGELQILKLRQYSEAQLGPRFDLKKFHDEVLGAGALPLDVLSARLHAWVAAQKTHAADRSSYSALSASCGRIFAARHAGTSAANAAAATRTAITTT